jgi:hypothetical protein
MKKRINPRDWVTNHRREGSSYRCDFRSDLSSPVAVNRAKDLFSFADRI